ncbi:MAG TPA: hypothetical protein VF796_02535 [Humisphaera sp.]
MKTPRFRVCGTLCATALVAATVAVAAAGCGSRPKPGGPAATLPIRPAAVAGAGVDAPVVVEIPGRDPAGTFYLDIFQVSVPFGAVSRSREFWRPLDEEHFTPAVKDLLLKNGLRAGVGANADWDYFRGLIERHPHAARSGSAVASGRGDVELEMRKNVIEQDIFVLTSRTGLTGRTYDYCTDLFGVGFWPDPRRPGQMWISVTPTVRSLRYRLEYTPLNQEKVLREFQPESMFELNLQTLIRSDKFLVLGLSELGDRQTSLGNQFLTLENGTERQEQVLIFVPRFADRRLPAATRNAPQVDESVDPGK